MDLLLDISDLKRVRLVGEVEGCIIQHANSNLPSSLISEILRFNKAKVTVRK